MYSLKRLWLRDQGVYKQWASLMDRAGLNKEESTITIYWLLLDPIITTY